MRDLDKEAFMQLFRSEMLGWDRVKVAEYFWEAGLKRQFNPTQLRDLEYICELAQAFLKGTEGTWPDRIERYRQVLKERL